MENKSNQKRLQSIMKRHKTGKKFTIIDGLSQNKTILTILILLLITGIYLNLAKPGIGYAILINGEQVGYTKSPSSVKEIITDMDKELRMAKGDDINYQMDVDFIKGKLGDNPLTEPEDLKIIVASKLDVKKPAYLVKTSQGIAFAINSKESANEVMKKVKEPYLKGKKNAEAKIVNNVSLVKSENISVDKILNSKQALAFINSPNARAVSRSTSRRAKVEKRTKPIFDVQVSYDSESTATITRPVEKVTDSSMYEGDSKVKQEGSDGIKEQNNRVTELNGQVISTEVITEKIIKEAVPRIIAVGTKPKLPGVLKEAYKYIGVPYVWGGTSPSGFDCSGFVQYVFARNGVYLPRTTYDQINVGKRIPYSQLRPGDIVHFPGHVGIYVGGGQMIHAPRTGRTITVESIGSRRFITGTRVQ